MFEWCPTRAIREVKFKDKKIMSVVKSSQIHDGFATIRTRGLQRSRSRVEQLERLRPISMKSDSMPLYENNNNIDSYYAKKFGAIEVKPVRVLKKGSAVDYDDGSSIDSRLSSFKSEPDNYLEITDKLSLAPPSPCYENLPSNGFQTPRTPESPRAPEYFSYSRSTSPLYERFSTNGFSDRSVTKSPLGSCELYNSPSKLFSPSYYRKPHDGEFALQKVTAKPPFGKTQALQYRKSFSHPAQTIYESTLTPKYDRTSVKNFYNSATNYYDPVEIAYGTYNHQATTSSEMLSLNGGVSATPKRPSERFNGHDRRYATLAHPKDTKRYQRQQEIKYAISQHSASHSNVDYLDPLDHKIGCQTMLRSKPQIPWYELAIRKDNRRQSCPPFQVIFAWFFVPLLVFLFGFNTAGGLKFETIICWWLIEHHADDMWSDEQREDLQIGSCFRLQNIDVLIDAVVLGFRGALVFTNLLTIWLSGEHLFCVKVWAVNWPKTRTISLVQWDSLPFALTERCFVTRIRVGWG